MMKATKKATKTILNRLKEKYNNVDERGWKHYLNIKIGSVKSKTAAPFYTLQEFGEKALRDFPECMSSGEITDDEIISNAIQSVRQ